jgi:uncharacterized protein
MKWEGRRQSDNVEDRRGNGSSGGKVALGGGLIGIVALLFTIFGGEKGQMIGNLLNEVNQGAPIEQVSEQRALTKEEQELGDFSATVFADCEDVWNKIFKENNSTYTEPKMVLFSDQVNTSCGTASAAVGPFYCPADQKVYMDLEFFNELKTKFGAKGGDFAIAYVIAHEVGHHIQTVLGTSGKVRELQSTMTKRESNKLSVCLELQADFYAGVFAHHNKQYLEAGDIDEALSAAHAVGDDAIQKRMQGHVVPDSFTHGTSEQRKKWFKLGFETGDIKYRDTFASAGFRGVE